MKRLNPQTNLPFKRGDVREDGLVFFNYTTRIRGDGYFMERWLTKEASDKARRDDRVRKATRFSRKSTRMPKNYRSLLKHDKFAIEAFKRAWRIKQEDPDWKVEDIEFVMTNFEEYIPLIVPDYDA